MKKPIFLLIVLCLLLSACNSGKNSPSSGHGTPGNGNTNPEDLPGTPRNLTATAGDRQVTLNWEAPSTVGASAITHYEYQYKMASGTFGNTWTNVFGGGSAREVVVSGLTSLTSYTFHVRAMNAQGPGKPSTEMEAIAYDGPTPEPGAPPTLTATPGDLQVTLGWEAPSAGASPITHYEYQYSTTSGTFGNTWTRVSGDGSARQVVVSGLTGLTSYTFHVRAVNTQGSGAPSTEIDAIAYDGPTPEPGPPGGLRVIPGDRQVTLNWEAPSRTGTSSITRYEYQYSTTSGIFGNTWTKVPNGASALEITIPNLIGATSYTFRVRAVNAQGGGHFTSVSATPYDGPTPEPGVPTNLAVTSGDHQVTLNWNAPSTVGASAITSYEYQYSTTSGIFGNTWTPVSGDGSTRQVTVSSLLGATSYTFRVRAVNTQGTGTASEEIEAIAYDGATPEPGVPPTLTATPGDRQVTLGWEASSLGASVITHYEYQYSTTSSSFGSTWTRVSGDGSARQVTVSNLTGGTNYFFRVRAVNAQGAGMPSTEIEAIAYDGPTPEPGAPGNLRAIPGDRQVTLNWEAPSRIGNSAITSYEYQYKTTSGTFDNTWTDVPNWESALEITISNLTGATNYFFRVRAVNAQGKGHSTQVSVTPYDGATPEPGAPTNLMATSGDRQVTLGWEASSLGASEIIHYEYQYRTTSSGTFGNTWTDVPNWESSLEITIPNLIGATNYSFRVRAVNAQGPGAPSTEMEAIAYDGPTPEPGAPTNLTPTSGDRQVTLNWNAPSTLGASAITSYEYQYETTSGTFDNTWTEVPNGASVLEITVRNLTSGTTYTFRVRAVNAQGIGTPSTEVEAIAYDGPTPEPGAPTNLTPTSGNRQVTLNWNAPSTVGASAITHYEYQYKTTSGAFDNTWTNVPSTGTTATVSSLLGATSYTFRVRAVNAQGAGIPSTEMEATAYDGPTPEPGAPTDLTPTSGDRQVTLNWNAPSTLGASAITSYEYQYRTTSSGTFDNTWTNVPGTETTATVSSLLGATSYTFRVRAVNAQGTGTASEEIEAIAYDGPTPEPGAPTDLTPTSGDRQVTLNWNAPSTVGASVITHYEYQYETTSGTFDNTWINVPGIGTTATVSSLLGATSYTFRVRAVNAQGPGTASTEMEAIAYDGPTPEPGAPPRLRATSGDHQVTLNWEASSLGASSITRYEYQYSTTSGTFGDTWTEVSNWESVLEVTIESLIAGTTYYFQMRAVNAQGAGIPSNASQAPHDGIINPETVCSDPATTDSALPGMGTVDNPFALCSPAHLSLIGDTGTDEAYTLSASYVMGQDINLNNVSFTPIAGAFAGTLDGRDKKIMNLKIHVSGHAALFVKLGSGGNIKNLGIEEFDVTGSGRVGSLVANNFGTLTNCYAVDSDESTDLSGGASPDYVGGLVGYQEGGSITSSYATGEPKGGNGKDDVGGLVGYQDSGSITSSYATGDIDGGEGADLVGGLVGRQYGGIITSSYATGHVDGSSGSDSVGGLVGRPDSGSITSSYATGDIDGGGSSDNVGGLVGLHAGGSATFSYATGHVDGEEGDSDLIGSLVGFQIIGSVTSSYGFGATANGETSNTQGAPPSGVSSASALTQANSGNSNTNRWSTDAWDFGTSSQAPALKYVDSYELGNHDNDAGTTDTYAYTCTSNTAFSPPVSITCGTTLLPRQPSRICSDSDSILFGMGIVHDPFVLCSPAHLSLIGDTVTNTAYTLSASYAMGQDINLNNVSFTPIAGTFTGTLDGRDKKIMNLTINVSRHGALFIKLGSGGNIKNLGIKEFDVTGSGEVGSLVATSLGTITNCYAVDSDNSTDVSGGVNSYMGGLVANLDGGSITSSYATGSLSGGGGYSYVGGLVGRQGGGSITSSYATGNSGGGSGYSYVGGLVGLQDFGSITSSYATGKPKGGIGNDDVGGLLGKQQDGSITSSYATGDIDGGNGDDKVGGLVGYQSGGTTISSYATGKPKGGGNSDNVGGLVGAQSNGFITSSYATGSPDGGDNNDHVGGLVGYQDYSFITSSYATGDIDGGNGHDDVGGLVGYLTGGFTISSYATGDIDGGSGNDDVGGLVGYLTGGFTISSYATGSPDGGGDSDNVGGLVGHQEGGSITSGYATGNPKGGSGNDNVGGLLGRLSLGSLTSSYATGNPDGGGNTDKVGGLVGYKDGGGLTSSYGFGTTVNGETSNTHGASPSGVSSASGLTQTNSGTSDTNRWSTDAWNFGTSSQAPALKYVTGYVLGNHDNDGSTPDTYGYTCTSNTAFLPPVNITCGTTLLPNQR